MQNFLCLASGVDTVPILNALACQPALWDQETLRTTHLQSPHTQVSDILLRFDDLTSYRATGDVRKIIDQHESVNHPAMFALPQVRPVIFDLMRKVEGERLGRVLITKLRPGHRIAEHVDGGEHAEYYSRYHIMLQNAPGSTFFCGDEQVYMAAGSVWWFDNSKLHSVVNNSIDERITLIVDIRTFR